MKDAKSLIYFWASMKDAGILLFSAPLITKVLSS